MKPANRALFALLSAVVSLLLPSVLHASSHREAPAITKSPKVDATDFYMFRSYETGRSGYVTLLANYEPFQDPQGGPNFYMLDPDAVYEIHVDNLVNPNGSVTFQFRFQNTPKNLSISVGGQQVAVPVLNIGPVGNQRHDTDNLNVLETYTLDVVRGGSGRREPVTAVNGESSFRKPVDRIGDKSIRGNDGSAYPLYADDHIYEINIPGCSGTGRVFVGQRREGFVINVGEIFDLFNLNPLAARDSKLNDLAGKNITTLALEVPTPCLARPGQPVIGGFTTASVTKSQPQGSSPSDFTNHPDPDRALTQVSRLGSPLVNEVVIGLPDKDKFNASEPKDDAQFLKYVTNPTIPELLELIFPGTNAPITCCPVRHLYPRADLVQAFLTGIPGLNQAPNPVPGEMLRLNTSIDPKPAPLQKSLGVLENDLAGFPNGRRPGDDVVDIELRVLMGALLPAANAPDGNKPFTDGALTSATIGYTPNGRISTNPMDRLFRDQFPYLQTPLSPSPQPAHP